jgi:type II secretory pathway component HofQ
MLWMAALLLGSLVVAGADPSDETRISLTATDADVKAVVSLLAEAGGVQPVFDPDVSCRLTLALKEAPLDSALGSVLHACGLAQEQEGNILRVARVSRLESEARQRRELKQEQERSRPRALRLERLSYARAQEIAPLLKKLLREGSDVVMDARTNTLIIID